MKLDSRHFLKWLQADHPALKDQEFRLIGQGLFYAKDATGRVGGLTVFEVRDFDSEFVRRLHTRMEKPGCVGCEFGLILSPLYRHRAESLLGRESRLKIEYSPFIHVRNAGGIFTIRSRMRVVSVDDSPVLLKLLKQILGEMGFVDSVEQISDPRVAVDTILRVQPDAITLDIQMPGLTGVDVVRQLLAKKHFPVILISSLALEEGSLVIEALNAGAFDYLPKPKFEERTHFGEELQGRLLEAAKGVSATAFLRRPPVQNISSTGFKPEQGLLWCLGASTGGTQALTEVFRGLPAEIPPTLVVQHIPPLFSRAFANSLNDLCPFTVKEAEDGEVIKANHVYIAAGGMQMGVVQRGKEIKIAVRDEAPVNRFKPSVDYLFQSVSKLRGVQIVAGLMTGMGKDGAKGLLDLRQIDARTFAQDEASSAVYGMPRAAVEIGATEKVVSLDQIAQTLMSQSMQTRKSA